MEKVINITVDRAGVDEASDTVRRWLESTGVKNRDIMRIRLAVEEILINICEHGQGSTEAGISLYRRFGTDTLRIRYGGERFDPGKPADNEAEEFTQNLLKRTGILPAWRWRFGRNEVTIPVSVPKKKAELLMLGCITAAAVIGLLGQYIPEPVRDTVIDYGLSFLSGGFLGLLNTFIGLMIFLTVITGICGIGSTAALGRVGKQMMIRFIAGTFAIGALLTVSVRLFFPLAADAGGSGSGFLAILEMIFGILPSNPVRPFLDGNTLQIVFMAVLAGIVLLLTGSQTENLRKIITELQAVVMRCVTFVCMFLPVYIFSSLVSQLWANGPAMLAEFWKPLVLCAVLSAMLVCAYLAYTCWKLKVRPSVLAKKLMPDFIIALSTSSSSAAFTEGMDINEQKLGIDRSFSRMAFPIGGILFAGSYSLLFILTGAFLAECYGIHADIAWWGTMWIVSSLLAVATPPVAGGNISCLSVMMVQLHIPPEGLAIGVVLAMFLDFICTGARIPILHMELALQADRMGLIDLEVLRK
ncbi:MAG: cation:dicarboxylase symporter family transporter [Solobacterium sp.]|nr:cation:dicarboxylase symporter family transporter [Solobacterium sp.]